MIKNITEVMPIEEKTIIVCDDKPDIVLLLKDKLEDYTVLSFEQYHEKSGIKEKFKHKLEDKFIISDYHGNIDVEDTLINNSVNKKKQKNSFGATLKMHENLSKRRMKR